jgi:hypothetical protein
MQYSSNSNAGLAALIFSHPTPAGQYRQAMLQVRDRQHALEDFDLERRKQEQTILVKQAERLQVLAVHTKTVAEEQMQVAKAALIELEIEYATRQIQRTQELVDDALRELAFCQRAIEIICQQSQIDFQKLDEMGFQQLMAIDFAKKRDRWIASRILAMQAGLPIDAAEMLLEIPESERRETLRKAQLLLEPFVEASSIHGSN